MGIPENRCPTNIGLGWVFNLLKIFNQGSIDLTFTCQFFLEKRKDHQTRVEIDWSCKAHNRIELCLFTFNLFKLFFESWILYYENPKHKVVMFFMEGLCCCANMKWTFQMHNEQLSMWQSWWRIYFINYMSGSQVKKLLVIICSKVPKLVQNLLSIG